MPVFDVDAYVSSLKTKYNIADDDLKPVAEIKQGFLRQDEFGRKMSALDTDRTKFEADRKQLTELADAAMRYESWVQSIEQKVGLPREQWSTGLRAQVGAANPDGTGTVAPTGITQADLERALKAQRDEMMGIFSTQLEQVGQGAAVFAEFYLEANEHWKANYGGMLPKDDFKKFFQEGGHTNPRVALQLFEAPFKAEKEKSDWERKLAEAEQRGEQRVRSQLGIQEVSTGAGGWFTGTSIGHAADNAAPNDESKTIAEFGAAFRQHAPAAPASVQAPVQSATQVTK